MEARKEVWGGTEQANIGASQQREADGPCVMCIGAMRAIATYGHSITEVHTI